MTEVELKFHLAPGQCAALRRAAALAGARPARQRLRSTYFDTPDCELAGHAMVLRLRQGGRRWIEGLKAGASGTGGMHSREEWEFTRRDAVLDLARFAHTPLAKLDGAASLHLRLVPAFRVDVMRTAWTLAPAPGARLEVALDEGSVESRGRREAISELEIECLEGDPAAAFDLAARLLEEVTLRPSATTKAQRGYRLFRGERLAAAKSRPVHLEASMSPLAAARRVVGAGLDQLQANEEGLLGTADPEFVHQARIALRRMRAALRLFRDAVGAERAARWRSELGDVARALGAARDWDVLALETLPAVSAAFGNARLARSVAARAARRRLRERASARAAVDSPRYARAILELSRWLSEASAAAEPGGGPPLADFASRVIRKRHKRLLRDAARLPGLSIEERHRVRIDAKRLRYGTDAFTSLFSSRRVGEYRDAVASLQDALGVANDAATAGRLLPQLAPPEPFAAFARGWLVSRAQADPALLEPLIDRLAGTRRFWRGKARSAPGA